MSFAAACGGQEEFLGRGPGPELTSEAAVERTLELRGYVYVSTSASHWTIQRAVQKQVRTAFGPLRIAKISVDDREFESNTKPATFKVESVEVVKKAVETGDTGTSLTPGSANALGVVAVANDPATTVQILDIDIGISSTAAKNIVAGRPFTTVKDVDDVWGVGAYSLGRILSYAKAHGYVDSAVPVNEVIERVKKVSYLYTARALVKKSLASRSSFSLSLLMGDYQKFVNEILPDCVENPDHDSEFASSFWYVWSSNEKRCKTLIAAEVRVIEQERAGLGATQIGEKERARRYLPINARLVSGAAPRETHPEYDQLYGVGDAAKKRIRLYQIVGVASHDGDPADTVNENDLGFKEFFKTIKVLADRWEGLRVGAGSAADPTRISFKGTTYEGSLEDVYYWVVMNSSYPKEIAYSDRQAFRRAIHDQVKLKWITLEVDLDVATATESKKVTLEMNLLFGTTSSYSVRQLFRTAFSKGDVVLYNGHSYIGSGPLDPSNYRSYEFNDNYQIFFFNSCVSFNYYSVDYFDLKASGTQKLDLVTNGIEVYIRDGGKSMGQFIVALFDGGLKSWREVLKATQVSLWYGVHDPNRAVDGEQDNSYDPSALPITLREATVGLSVKNTSVSCGGAASGSITLSADAEGAEEVEFFVGGASLTTQSTLPYEVSWDTTTVGDGVVTVMVRAHAADGGYTDDSCTLTVTNTASGDLLNDAMEEGASGWKSTGLWNLASEISCASPSYASGTHAWYFGQQASCNYDIGQRAQGSLTSPLIAGVSTGSMLSFATLRQVESHSGSYDQTFVEVAEEGSDRWKVLWSKSSKDAASTAWTQVEALSLGEFAGKSVRVRFRFDSVDGWANAHLGWLIDDVRVTR
ncbi:MAG: hypothetical protein JRH20_18525 [Deltaproteobacteria bacterium]|nr:hypothetical protein [Deltaproteobacteria bacterium]